MINLMSLPKFKIPFSFYNLMGILKLLVYYKKTLSNMINSVLLKILLMSFFYKNSYTNGYKLLKQAEFTFDQEPFIRVIDGYEIPSPIINKAKKSREKKFDAAIDHELFDQKYTAYLEETDHVLFGWSTPLYIASVDSEISNKIIYDRVQFPIPGQKVKCFENCTKKATVTAYDEIVREWPVNINTTNDCSSNIQGKCKRGSISNDYFEIVYPEILVVVDFEIYKAHDKDLVKLSTYMASFWNAVDLRFRELKEPQIRINIAGLVVATDPGAEPYLKGESKNYNNFDNFTSTFQKISDHFSQKFPGKYDVISVITRQSLQKNKTSEVVGYAFGGRDCKDRLSIAVSRDSGGFDGIIIAAHELGHVFGAPHDGPGSDFDEEEGPCPLIDGYMMSNRMETENRLRWSKCSKIAMSNYLRSSYADCMRNRPDLVVSHLKKLPGKLLTRDEQCDLKYPGYISVDQDNCSVLRCKKCFIKRMLCVVKVTNHDVPPAEGSACGVGKFCLNGKCVEDFGLFD